MFPITFINPPSKGCIAQSLPVEDLSIGYSLAALRAAKYPTCVIDADMDQLTVKKVERQVAEEKCSAIILPLMYRTLPTSLEIIHEIRRLTEVPILGYRYAATLSCFGLMENEPGLDAVILGETEHTLLDLAFRWQANEDWRKCPGLLVRRQDGTLCLTPRRKLIENLDELPFPSRDRIIQSLSNDPVVEILSSRGCYAHCTFCNVRLLYAYNEGSAWRARSPQNVVDEMEHLYRKYGVCQFEFADESFIGPGEIGKKRVRRIAEEILTRRLNIDFRIFCRVDHVEKGLFSLLKEAGLRVVNVGLESGSNQILQRFKKGITVEQSEKALQILRELDLTVLPSFIMFEPTMTLDELTENLDYVQSNQLWNCVNPTSVIPFEGTEFTRRLQADDLLSSSEFIIDPYIPKVRFASPQTEQVFEQWTEWQKWCDTQFGKLASMLNSAYYIVLERSFPIDEQSAWFALRDLFVQMKHLEIAYIRRVLQPLENDQSDLPTCLDYKDVLNDLSDQAMRILSSHPTMIRRLGLLA